jgi:hypothetical protein
MKKLVLATAILLSTYSFAQKSDLKTLNKISNMERPSQEDLTEYKDALKIVKELVKSDDDKNSLSYFKTILPIVDINSFIGGRPTADYISKTFAETSVLEIAANLKSVIAYEEKSGTKTHTDGANKNLARLLPLTKQMAFGYNDSKNYKMASESFYNLYKLDPKDLGNLENAGITANQAQDFVRSEKNYRELKALNYTGEKMEYFAVSKISGKEEYFAQDNSLRDKSVSLGTHEKPRNEKLPSRKGELYKMIAELAVINGNLEQAKADYDSAQLLRPDDVELLTNHANLYYKLGDLKTYKTKIEEVITKDPTNAQLYYNVGFLTVSDDNKIVEEINKNLKNKAKYDELNKKRKDMFSTALPYFEKAYQFNNTNQDYKDVLKNTYEILGMKEKAATIK